MSFRSYGSEGTNEMREASLGDWVRYEDVAADVEKLAALEAHGVDNCDGYSDAMASICKNCRYFRPHGGSAAYDGRCYRFPPVAKEFIKGFVAATETFTVTEYEHVEVCDDYWCGEWKGEK